MKLSSNLVPSLVSNNNFTSLSTNNKQNTKRGRWNHSQLHEWISSRQTITDETLLDLTSHMDQMPSPEDAVLVYNRDSWRRIRVLLGLEGNLFRASSKRVVLCANGGSSTADSSAPMKGLDSLFAFMIQTTQRKVGNISVVNMGHGWRDSLHSAFLLPWFVPAETDILIGEWALNDMYEDLSMERSCEEVNNGILLWLNQLARRERPPLIILAYFWDAMAPGATKYLKQSVYQCHSLILQGIIQNFDFIVGSVNVAAYLSDPSWTPDFVEKYFLKDHHHPSSLGHWLAAFLMWDLVSNHNSRTISSVNSVFPRSPSRLSPHFTCDSSISSKRQINSLLEEKHPFLSWTNEEPNLAEYSNDGMMYPRLYSNTSAPHCNFSSTLHGKAKESRQDRKWALDLPCCTSGKWLGFELNGTKGIAEMKSSIDITGHWVSAVHAHFPDAVKHTQWPVTVDPNYIRNNVLVKFRDLEGQSLFESGDPALEWVVFDPGECHLDEHYLNPWLVLPETTFVSTIEFCNMNLECGGRFGGGSILHVVLV